MQCAFCKETIDDDSFYCDMCGEEIKVCPGCKKPGKRKVCTSCGKALVSLKPQAGTRMESETAVPAPASAHSVSPPVAAKASKTQPPADSTYRLPEELPAESTVPQLRLLNKNINVDLKIDDNSVIGRTTGQYVGIFQSYNQVSGKHCSFNYVPEKGWIVTDLGSTNKTQYNSQTLSPNIPQALNDQTFLKIANIEFFVQIVKG